MKVERRSLLRAMSVGAALAPVLWLESASASQCDRGSQDAGAAKVVQMDPNVSFAKQIERNLAPVVLRSTFLVKPRARG